METKTYLKDTIKVSRLGFGGWPLGNTAHGETMSIDAGVELVLKAYHAGINFFDTAPNYAGGRSEIIIGKALENVRDQVVINTKFGHHPDGSINFDSAAIRPSIMESLKRLKTPFIDSVILHNPDMNILKNTTDHFTILDTLKKERIIKGYGVSIDTVEELKLTLKNTTVDVIELLYNVFAQSTRSLLDAIKDKGIALIIKVPLDSGWLTGKFSVESKFTGLRSRWTQADIERRDKLTKHLKTIVNDDVLTPYALRFLWSYDAITTVIPGIRTQAQLKEHLSASNYPLDKALKQQFETLFDEEIASDLLPW